MKYIVMFLTFHALYLQTMNWPWIIPFCCTFKIHMYTYFLYLQYVLNEMWWRNYKEELAMQHSYTNFQYKIQKFYRIITLQTPSKDQDQILAWSNSKIKINHLIAS